MVVQRKGSLLIGDGRRSPLPKTATHPRDLRRVYTSLTAAHEPPTATMMAQAESSSAAANRNFRATANGSSAAHDLP
ncbi:MAG: hypothetical protein L6R42_007279, partial [Xanthoria sp. 1 TBL-2021]